LEENSSLIQLHQLTHALSERIQSLLTDFKKENIVKKNYLDLYNMNLI